MAAAAAMVATTASTSTRMAATAKAMVMATVPADSWMPWLKFVHVSRWHKDGDATKKGAPLDFEEA
jgi:hypothetical protein